MIEVYVLPQLDSAEAAELFGFELTPSQYVFISGAHAALTREFNQCTENSDRRVELATKIQLLREALEAAPHATLCALLPYLNT